MKLTTFLRGLLVVLGGTFTLYSQTGADSHNFHAARLQRIRLASATAQQLPSSATCLADYGIACYAPSDIHNAYGITPLLAAGYTGWGQTIVIIVSYGSPTIEQDLKAFDTAFGLPDPPSFRVLAPLGTVPFDPTDSEQLGWAGETSLDVQWAHAMAPNASIVVLTSPVNETEGTQGLPEFLKLEEYALDHHLGQIITQSWGATENTLFDAAGRKVLNDFEKFYERAAGEGVTVLASTGDYGTSNPEVNGTNYSFATVNFPASSPYVTAVGGTTLNLDVDGNYGLETVWNESAAGAGASGGGVSQYFSEPLFQYRLGRSTQRQLGGYRGLPDVASNADPFTPVWVYFGFFADPTYNGFSPAGNGTSEASPTWAGIVADANQMAGRPLGFLNPKLYAIGASGEQSDFFHDIKVGNNAYNGLPGYEATAGFDLASGWGTPNLSRLLWELCRP